MSTIAEEIQRLKLAKSDIKTSLINKGVAVDDTATLDTYPALIDSIASNPTISVRDYGIKFAYSSFSEVPEWADFEGVTDMSYMFYQCWYIETIPFINTSNVTDMAFMVCRATVIKSIPLLDTSQVTNMDYMFNQCFQLQSLPLMDMSQVTSTRNMLKSCGLLTDLGGFIGLKCNLDLSSCRAITHDSIMNVINKASDVTASPATLTLGSTNLAKITDEEKAVATNKGWTLA